MTLLEILLVQLGEESAEIIKDCSKALRFGINEQRDLPTSNKDRICGEINDFIGVVEMLQELPEFQGWIPDRSAIDEKKRKVAKYLVYSHECGQVDTVKTDWKVK